MSARRLVVFALVLTSASAAAQSQRDRQVPARDRGVAPVVGTGIIAGVVVTADERAQPVRRASVMLTSGVAAVPRTAVTDDEGRFQFTGLPAGNYTLVGQKPAWVTSIYGSRSVTDSQGIPIAVVDGQRVEGLRLVMGRGAVVAGTVRFASGVPASGIAIQVLRVRTADGRRQASITAAPAQTDDQGAYRVFGLPAGDYVVQARSQSFMNPGGLNRQVTEAEVRWGDQQLAQAKALAATSAAPEPAPAPGPTVTYSAVYFPGTAFLSDAAIVTVAAGTERSGVDFVMPPVPTGRVSGLVLMPDGSPAASASVALELEGGDNDMMALMSGVGRTSTARDGRFAISNVTPGQYKISVRAIPRRGAAPDAGSVEAMITEARAALGPMGALLGGENPSTLWATDAVAVNGQDVGPLTVQLRDGLTIEGTVVLEGGGPPPDATSLRIAVAAPPSGDPVMALVSRMMSSAGAVPAADGTFVVRGLIPGTYGMTLSGKSMRQNSLIPGGTPSKQGWVVKSIRWRSQDLADTGVDIQKDGGLTGVVVTLTDKPAELSGTVTDAAGRPTGAFPIVVYAADRGFWRAGSRRVVQAQPASDGQFSVIGLPAGDYYVAAVTRLEPGDLENRQFLEDLVPSAIRLSLTEGQKKTQDLKLSAGG
jgi:uncharacterized protein (DUF2141 family)